MSNFTNSTDAEAWAKEFVARAKHDPEFATDEATMLGWFANAIMAGYDEAHRKYEMVNLNDYVMGQIKEMNDRQNYGS